MNTESELLPNKDGNLKCTANTSQTPSFEWKINVGSEKEVNMDNIRNTFKRLQCFVHYTIRGKKCTLNSTIISEEGTKIHYRFYY